MENIYMDILSTVSKYLILNELREEDDDYEQIPEPFSIDNIIACVLIEQLRDIPKKFKTLESFKKNPMLLEEFIDYDKVCEMMADLCEEKTEIFERIEKKMREEENEQALRLNEQVHSHSHVTQEVHSHSHATKVRKTTSKK